MYCPNCGNINSAGQKFCRSCGLGLAKVTEALTEQLPTKADKTVQQQKDRLERLGMMALGIFGLGLLSFFFYSLFVKLLVAQGRAMAALFTLGAIIILGCGFLSAMLFAKAKELREGSANRQLGSENESEPEPTNRLLHPHKQPTFSVADRTTDLLPVERRKE